MTFPASHNYDVVGLGVSTVDILALVEHFPTGDDTQPALAMGVQGGGPVASALAALARLALTQGDLPSAIAYVEEIWRYLQTNNLDGLDEPFLVYLICCQVLRAAEDERFRPLLERAYQLLQNQALRISDPEMRKSFLHNVVAHSELAKLWEASQP